MKTDNPKVQANKGQAPLCNSCAHQFLHPEGHNEPCSVASVAVLSEVNGHGMGSESCTHYIYRTTKKEEVHEMSEKKYPATQQPPTMVTLAGPASVNLVSHFSPQDNKTKHTLGLSLTVSEEDLEKVRQLTKQKGAWFVELGVEGVQASMDEVLAKESDESMRLDAGQESRIEETAGQKAAAPA